MTTLTIDMPEPLYSELRKTAEQQQISTESLLVEMARRNLREIAAERHFRERAARGNPERGLALLEEIARRENSKPS
jgi:hypothetical protein